MHPIPLLPNPIEFLRRALVPVSRKEGVVDTVVGELAVHGEVLPRAKR